jgi:hypothetical protein
MSERKPKSSMTLDEAAAYNQGWQDAIRVCIEIAWQVNEESIERGSDAHIVAERIEKLKA